MELDTLKYIWKQATEDPDRRQSSRQILEMLKKKSQLPVARMKRNLPCWSITFSALKGSSLNQPGF
jgi:hypothetical protein